MSQFKIGDQVMIVQKSTERVPDEFENGWVGEMDKRIGDGNIYTVHRVSESGVYMREISMGWPPASLRLVTGETAPIRAGQTMLAASINSGTTKSNGGHMELKIEDRVYVNGNQAKDMSADQLINTIAEAEKEIDRLSKLTTSSTAIKARIESLKAGAARLATLLDAR